MLQRDTPRSLSAIVTALGMALAGCEPTPSPPHPPADADGTTHLADARDAAVDAGPEGEWAPPADSTLAEAGSDAGAGPDDGGPALPAEALQIRAATWNVARFFDTVCDSGECGKYDFEDKPSEWEFGSRAAEIASAIETLDADVVLLEEVESQACLDAVVARLGDRYPIAVLGETHFDGSLDVAVLASAELIEVRTHRQDAIPEPGGGLTSFSREFLEVHLAFGGWRVVAFAAHFKSKNQDDAERRLAEANAARKIVRATAEELPDALVLLGGDLNDEPGSETLDAVEQGGFLVRVAGDLPSGSDWTYMYNADPVALDHLYLASEARGTYVAGTAAVVRDSPTSLGGSDHAALRADFALAP